jgi:formate-dependent nitrite reductase membrane component NrfD
MESGKKLVINFLGKMTQIIRKMEIFKDNNDWNEKSVVGFIAFAIMCVIMIVDLITGWFGRDLMINEFVYDSFVLVVLGCFGISGLEKFAKK